MWITLVYWTKSAPLIITNFILVISSISTQVWKSLQRENARGWQFKLVRPFIKRFSDFHHSASSISLSSLRSYSSARRWSRFLLSFLTRDYWSWTLANQGLVLSIRSFDSNKIYYRNREILKFPIYVKVYWWKNGKMSSIDLLWQIDCIAFTIVIINLLQILIINFTHSIFRNIK